MKQYTFLKEFYVIPAYYDLSNTGGVVGAVAGLAAPPALAYLYFKLVKQARYKKELRMVIDGLSNKELDNQIAWIVGFYGGLLNKKKIASRMVLKIKEMVDRGVEILKDKDAPDEVKKQYIFDVTFKYKVVSKISYSVLSKYDSKYSSSQTFWMVVAMALGSTVGSLVGAEISR